MALWYLSFAGEEGWRGGIYTHAASLELAIHKTASLNPGGELMVMEGPPGYVVPELYLDKLLTRKDLEDIDGEPPKTLSEMTSDERAIVTEHAFKICEECLPGQDIVPVNGVKGDA